MSLFKFLKYRIKYKKNSGNQIIIHKKDGKIIRNPFFLKVIKVFFYGKNSTLELYEPYELKGSIFRLFNGDHFIIKENVQGVISVTGGLNSVLQIGKGSTLCNGQFFLNDEENASIILGKDCMLSLNVFMWASDTHQILEKDSKNILNRASQGIKLGDHCWIGHRVSILKGVHLASNTIVGGGSVVTRSCKKPNCAIAGNPARVIKENIVWKREGFY